MSIHNWVSGYIKINLLELGVILPTPLSVPVPSPKQERKRAQHKHRPLLMVHRHHNKLEVRPTLLETKFQVSVPKKKGGLHPTVLFIVWALPENFSLFPSFPLTFGLFFFLIVAVLGFESHDGLQKFLLKKTSSFALKT